MAKFRNFRIAIIGSRSLHQNPKNHGDIDICYKVCYRFANLGITFTSGLCEHGMDAIAQTAYSQAAQENNAFLSQFEVYVSEKWMRDKSRLPNKHLAIIQNPSMHKELEALAKSLHANWSSCSKTARGLHQRNCHQILGYNLDNPVKAVLTWCEVDRNGEFKGGTATALKLAKLRGIPIFNLNTPDKQQVLLQIKAFLKLHKII